jgi:hypothetical protein
VFFSLLELCYAFIKSEVGIFFPSKSDGNLVDQALIGAKTKVHRVMAREMLLAYYFTG